MKTYPGMAILWLCPFFLHAQVGADCSITVTGKVMDEHDGSPLAFSEILIGDYNGTVADADGNYRLEGLCPGTYEIVCRHIGCEPVSISVLLRSDTVMHFYPEHHAELLKQVSIIAYSPTNEINVYKVLNKDDLAKMKGASLAEMAAAINGVSTLESGSNISKPVIRGMHGNRVSVAMDGMVLESQQWGAEHAPEVDAGQAETLLVHTGVDALKFGPGTLGGTVETVPATAPDSAGLKGGLSLTGTSNGRGGAASFQMIARPKGRLQPFYAGVHGTLKRSGNLHAPYYYLNNTGYREYDFGWRTGFSGKRLQLGLFYGQFNSDVGILAASHTGNLSDLEAAIAAEVPSGPNQFTYAIQRPRQHVEHESIGVNTALNISEKLSLHVMASRQYNKRQEYDSDTVFSENTAIPEVQFELTALSASAEVGYRLSETSKILGGAAIIRRLNTYEGRFFIPNYDQLQPGAYLGFTKQWQNWKLKLLARHDRVFQRVYVFEKDSSYTRTRNFAGWNAGARLERAFGRYWRAGVDIGTNWRPPSINELYARGLHHGVAAIEFGNEKLGEERAYFLLSDVKFDHGPWRLTASPYVYYFQNFIYLLPRYPPVVTIRGAFPAFAFHQAPAVYKGVDASVEYYFHDYLELGARVSFVRADEFETRQPVYLVPSDRYEGKVTLDLGRVSKLAEAGKWKIYMESTHIARQWRVPSNRDYAPAPPAYTLFNAGLALEPGQKENPVIINFAVLNIFNTPYRSYLDRFRYFADQKGRSFELRLQIPFNFKKQKQ